MKLKTTQDKLAWVVAAVLKMIIAGAVMLTPWLLECAITLLIRGC